jgi:hypothetical protein
VTDLVCGLRDDSTDASATKVSTDRAHHVSRAAGLIRPVRSGAVASRRARLLTAVPPSPHTSLLWKPSTRVCRAD